MDILTFFPLLVGLILVCFSSAGAEYWQSISGSEYEFFKGTGYSEYRNWYAARDRCRSMDADLVPLDDVSELHKFSDWIFGGESDNFWVGVDRLFSDDWKFTVTQKQATDVTLWDDGYPKDDDIKKCAYVTPKTKGRLRNENCGVNAYYICQRLATTGTEPPPTAPPIPTTEMPQGECPHGFRGVGDKCYRIFPDASMTWDAALGACSRLTSGKWPSLASFRSDTEYAVLLVLLGEQPDITSFLWFGLYSGTSPMVNFPWFWADNSLYDSTQSKFYNSLATGCAYIPPQSPGYWFVKQCDTTMGYVCQTYKDGSTTAAPSITPCPPEYDLYLDGCYKLHPEEQTWFEADEACRKETGNNGTLVSIHSSAENSAVLLMMAPGVTSAWIGLKKDEQTNQYVWSDGSVVTYSRWGPHQSLNCSGLSADGKWWSDSCDKQLPFVCKVPLGPLPTMPPHKNGSCPHSDGVDWVKHGDYCYQFHHAKSGIAFADALQRCTLSHSGGHLVTVHSEQENDFLYRFFLENSGSESMYDVWLGMYKNDEEEFTWLATGEAIQYENWFHGEPTEDNKCAILNTGHGHEKQWSSHICTSYLNFVCKVDVGPQVEPPPDAPGSCPDDEWYPYGSYCYLFRPEGELTWPNAHLKCMNLGADLVTIKDRAENEFLAEEAFEHQSRPTKRYMWIGLAKFYPDSPYIWVDTEPLNTTAYWDEGVQREDVASIVRMQTSTGLWYTDPIDSTVPYGYVCKIAKDTGDTTTKPGDSESSGDKGGLSGGEIAGIVIGVLLLVALVVLGALVVARYKDQLFSKFGQTRFENEA